MFKRKTWDKVTLYQFQQIDQINSREDLEEIDKLLFTTCLLHNLTEYQLDTMKPKKALRYINRTRRVFETEPTIEVSEPAFGIPVEYDISKVTFGQYIELAYFTQQPIIHSAHYILASLSGTENHRGRADFFLSQSVIKTLSAVRLFTENWKRFNDEYKNLFGVDEQVSGEGAKEDYFTKRYGWIYSASVVAEYERITLQEAYKLPVRQALNGLAYLKAKAKFETQQLKKSQ